VNKSLRSQKKKTLGKGYFPYSGEVTQVRKNGDYYIVKWGVMHPPNCEEGEESKRALRWDQLIPIKESEETTELVLQHFRQADSYNTSEVEPEIKEIKSMLRQRVGENGDLEVLCKFKKEKTYLEWKRVADVGRCKQYQEFMKDFEYWENMRKEGRKEEEKRELYDIEEYICKRGGSVLVLWENWNEPTWVSIRRICHLEDYKIWKEGEEFQEISEEEEIKVSESEDSDGKEEEEILIEVNGSEEEDEEKSEEESSEDESE